MTHARPRRHPTRPDEQRTEEQAVSGEPAYTVVVNDEEQYSIWEAGSEPPAGWRPGGFTGARADCLAHIERVWTDMRPRSVRAPAGGPA
jgi:MbtH protein